MPISVECDTCGRPKTKSPSQIKKHNFCSEHCRLTWFITLNDDRKNKVTRFCEWCGSSFVTYPCWMKRNEGKFCSSRCRDLWHSSYMSEHPETYSQLRTSEALQKLKKSKTGKRYSPEVNKKKGRSGEKNPFYGQKHSKETKALLSKLSRIRMHDSVYRQRTIEAALRGNRRYPNKAELKLGNILCRYFPGEWEYTGDGYHTIGGFAPDFTNCNGQKALIEMFGHYWHTRRDIRWNYTEVGRIKAYNALGFRCLVIWDYELKDEQAVVTKIRRFKELI